MASHRAAHACRTSRSSLTHALILLFTAASITGGCARDSRHSFHFSGRITAPPAIQKLTQRPNLVLYIVATNNGGVPIAIKKIINPRLPIHYRINGEDLILPGPASKGPFDVTVFVNSHGRLGVSQPGDLRGKHRGVVHSKQKHVDIIIDQKV